MNLEKRKRLLIDNYIRFMNNKADLGLAFYSDTKNYEAAKNFLNEFRATKNVFINGVQLIKSYYFLYSQCVCDYLELYLRDIGIVDNKSCAYSIPESLDNIDEILNILIDLVEEGLEEAEKCLNIGCAGFESINVSCIRGKRLILQKIIAVLALLDFEKETDKYLEYAEEAIKLGSFQAYATLVHFYTKKEHLDLNKARELFEQCIALPYEKDPFKVNNLSRVFSKLSAYSCLFHGYISEKEYDNALEIIKRNRQFLLLDECDVISEDAKSILFEILASFISYIKKQKEIPAKQTYEYDVFISYSSLDSLIAEDITNKLMKENVKVWRDVENIRGGDSFIEEIPAAIKNSRLVLLILTPEAEESKWVEKEIISAINEGKEIIPYKIGDYDSTSSIKFMLGNIQVMKHRTVSLGELVDVLTNKVKK